MNDYAKSDQNQQPSGQRDHTAIPCDAVAGNAFNRREVTEGMFEVSLRVRPQAVIW